MAVEVSHLGMPIPEPQANTRYTLIDVLDGLHVVELKETHLMKQAHKTWERGFQSWVRAVEKLPGGVRGGVNIRAKIAAWFIMSHTGK